MDDANMQRAQRISALVDGQLPSPELQQTLAELASDAQSRMQWDVYHVVGDVMRAQAKPLTARLHDPEFVLKLRQKMLQNATKCVAIDAYILSANDQKQPQKQAANEPQWRLVVGLASVAMLAVLTWQGLQWNPAHQGTAAQFAQQPLTEPATASLLRSDGVSALALQTEPQVMIRDPQLDALLAAHRQLSGAGALQTPAGFMRQAAFAAGSR